MPSDTPSAASTPKGGWCETHGGYTGERCGGFQYDGVRCESSAAQGQDEREIRRMVGQRLTEQQRAWLLKMPAWTAVRGEDILRHLDGLVTDNALLRSENERLREEVAELKKRLGYPEFAR